MKSQQESFTGAIMFISGVLAIAGAIVVIRLAWAAGSYLLRR